MLNISQYMPQSFVMQVTDEITITSPVPTVAAGKLIAAFQEVQVEQSRRALAGEELQQLDKIPGWPDSDEELARIVLGDEEYERLAEIGAAQVFITTATMCAVVYWANGQSEEAVKTYLSLASGETVVEPPKGNRAQRRSKSGRATA